MLGEVFRNINQNKEVEMPTLGKLGSHLIHTSNSKKFYLLFQPFVLLYLYILVSKQGWWFLTPIIVFFMFVAIVTVTHDIVHQALGFNRWQTEILLFIMGSFLLESGHAYRISHLQHHRVFPGEDDPEGDPARMTFFGSVIWGMIFLPRLWVWSIKRSKNKPYQMAWLFIESTLPFLGFIFGIIYWRIYPSILIYTVMVIVGSWIYPLFTVYLPHHSYGRTKLSQTRTMRGKVIPRLFLELTYHLEHHLYPNVPSHRLPELAKKLNPFFEKNGVIPVYIL